MSRASKSKSKNHQRLISVGGTGMSSNQFVSALKKDNAPRQNVVNHQPVSAGTNCKRCSEMGQYTEDEYKIFIKVLCRSVLLYTQNEGGFV